MRQRRRYVVPIAAICGLFILIIDAKTVVRGAQEGIQLCLQTLIPSLFPFLVVSGYFCSALGDLNMRILRPVMRLCHLPNGSSPLMVSGFLGGYPVGAKVIAESYQSGCISSAEARRMLGFCSNAGPAFILGLIGNQFQQPVASWCLMLITIVSAILTGYILPHGECARSIQLQKNSAGFMQNFNSSLHAIAAICGWVILFRVVLAFLDRWFLWLFPVNLQVIASGILELSNGCIQLYKINNDGLRLVIAAGMLSLGGLCVYLQTASLTAMLGTGLYFPGKIIQCLISIILSCIIQFLLFDAECRVPNAMILLSVATFFAILVIMTTRIKNNSRNSRLIAV